MRVGDQISFMSYGNVVKGELQPIQASAGYITFTVHTGNGFVSGIQMEDVIDAETKRLNDGIKACQQMNLGLTTALSKYNAQLYDKDTIIEGLQKEATSRVQATNELQKQLDDSAVIVRRLQRDNEDYKKTVIAISKERDGLRAETIRHLAEILTLRNQEVKFTQTAELEELRRYKREFEELVEERYNLKLKLKAANRNYDKIHGAYQALVKDYDVLANKHALLRDECKRSFDAIHGYCT